MKRNLTLLAAAGTLAIVPAITAASPPSGGPSGMHGPAATTATTASPSASPTGNGGGYNHQNSPQHETGQPKQSCETTGSPPGGSGTAPGSAFNQDGGTAGSNYAGEKAVNSRNTASSSQYDVACTHQPN